MDIFFNHDVSYNSTQQLDFVLDPCPNDNHVSHNNILSSDSSGPVIIHSDIPDVTLVLISVSGSGLLYLWLPPASGNNKLITLRVIKGGHDISHLACCSRIFVKCRSEDSINHGLSQFEIVFNEAILLRSHNNHWWTIFKDVWDDTDF
jgi:hypothetical protein